MKTSMKNIQPYLTKDGSMIRELMHPDMHGSRNLSFAVAEIEPGRATDLHRHALSEEIYHVTGGEGMMTFGKEYFSIQTGDTICIQPGTPHKVLNTGKEPLRILCCCAPPYSHSDTEIL
jgi:mannose-6-phosphate isomerase-like protein (cupin superfamily)